jgi:hypothetical protein
MSKKKKFANLGRKIKIFLGNPLAKTLFIG